MNFTNKNFINILNIKQPIDISNLEFIYMPIIKIETFLLENELRNLNETEKDKIFEIYNKGKSCIEKNHYKEALEIFLTLPNVVSFPLASGYYNLGCAYLYLRQYENAINIFNEAIKINKNFKHAYFCIAHAYFKLNKKEKAISEFQNILKGWSVSNSILFDLGTTYFLNGDNKNSIKYLLKEIKFNPKHGQAYNNLGVIYQDQGMYKEAISNFNNAIDLSSNYGKPYLNLAICHLKLNESDKAINCLHNLLQFYPNNKLAQFIVGFAYENIGNYYEAIEHYLNTVKISFNMAPAHLHLSKCYLERGFLNKDTSFIEDSISELNIYISLKPDDGQGYLLKGMIYEIKEKNIDAIRFYEKAIQCFAKEKISNIFNLNSSILLIDLLFKNNETSKAQLILKNTIKIFPNNLYLKDLNESKK